MDSASLLKLSHPYISESAAEPQFMKNVWDENGQEQIDSVNEEIGPLEFELSLSRAAGSDPNLRECLSSAIYVCGKCLTIYALFVATLKCLASSDVQANGSFSWCTG